MVLEVEQQCRDLLALGAFQTTEVLRDRLRARAQAEESHRQHHWQATPWTIYITDAIGALPSAELPSLGEGSVAAVADDHVVEHPDSEDLARPDQAPRELQIVG